MKTMTEAEALRLAMRGLSLGGRRILSFDVVGRLWASTADGRGPLDAGVVHGGGAISLRPAVHGGDIVAAGRT